MSKSPNRRAMLTGTIALAAAALPMVALAATPNTEPDAELFDLFRQWERGKELEISFGEEHSEMNRLADAKEPAIPPELLEPIAGLSGKQFPKAARGWTVNELEHFASLTVLPNFTRSKTDVGFDLHFVDEPVPHEVRAKARELLAIKNQYDYAYAAVWEEADTGQKRFDEIVSRNTDLIDRLAQTPALTLQGLLAKCHVSKVEHLFEWHSSFNEMAQSIVEDIERLAPQLTAKV